MAEGTGLGTMTGTTVALSATLPATYDSAGYTATGTSYTTIGKVSSVGPHGGSKNVASFTPLSDGVVEKFPGSVNYGQLTLQIGYLPSDTGQDLIDTAFGSTSRHSLKLTFPTKTGESTPEYRYLDVLCVGREWSEGGADDVRLLTATFEICRAPVRVAAT
jgi:hypothetical protein